MTVQVGARSRVVAVGERSGAGAARVVALVIAELLSAEAQPAAGDDAPTVTVTAQATPSAPPPTIVGPAPPPPAAEWARHLCLTAGAGRGTADEERWTGKPDVNLMLSPGPLGEAALIDLARLALADGNRAKARRVLARLPSPLGDPALAETAAHLRCRAALVTGDGPDRDDACAPAGAPASSGAR